YLMTLEVLYGNTPESEGKTKEERDDLYMEAMKELHKTYPNDHEATAFYGLSILGTAHEGRDYKIYMQAAAELFEVWNENRQHPGAAHYLIHSFDDPIHAPLGLPMAKVYSEIAPAAAHAQHMTSHIFLALGMWDDVVDANFVARNVQTDRQKELGEETTVCGHYPWWLQYGYLQEGEIAEAEQVLNTCSERVEQGAEAREKWHFAVMRGHQIIDAENWTGADTWTADYDTDTQGSLNYFYTSALAAIMRGNDSTARQNLRKMMELPESAERNIQSDQIKSLLLVDEGNPEEGLQLLKDAVSAELELPVDFGPPTIVKPSLELLGDVLLKMEKYGEAVEAYEKQLERTPKRRLSLLGKEKAMGMMASK
ncbi:MAG: tetratricopeptide repeat protein, partial [Candidatus Halalkalibacterium sp. M3_1C_030]